MQTEEDIERELSDQDDGFESLSSLFEESFEIEEAEWLRARRRVKHSHKVLDISLVKDEADPTGKVVHREINAQKQ